MQSIVSIKVIGATALRWFMANRALHHDKVKKEDVLSSELLTIDQLLACGSQYRVGKVLLFSRLHEDLWLNHHELE